MSVQETLTVVCKQSGYNYVCTASIPGEWSNFAPSVKEFTYTFLPPAYSENGTPLTLTFYVTGTGWWPTVTQAVALQLSTFGIQTKVISLEASTYYSLEVSCGLPAYGDWAYAGAKGGYLSQWSTYSGIQWISLDLYAGGWCMPGHVTPFAYPIVQDNYITGWYCKPLTTNLDIPNNTIVWCINSTFGYFNLSNWEQAMTVTAPGTATYHELVKVLSAWYLYWVPAVEISQIMLGQTFPIKYADPMWAYTCMNYSNPKYTAAAYSLFHDWASHSSNNSNHHSHINKHSNNHNNSSKHNNRD